MKTNMMLANEAKFFELWNKAEKEGATEDVIQQMKKLMERQRRIAKTPITF